MATATSSLRRRRARWAVLPIALALAAVLVAVVASSSNRPAGSRTPAAFARLHPAAAPARWKVARTRSGAELAYPPGWHEIATDSGTASAAPAGRRGVFRGYLNATPQGGRETLDNWSRFRVAHVAAEGAHDVRLEAAATGLRFRGARGSCVIDTYSTDAARFRELACIVAGRTTTVVVAAAPTNRWELDAPVLRRAVAAFAT